MTVSIFRLGQGHECQFLKKGNWMRNFEAIIDYTIIQILSTKEKNYKLVYKHLKDNEHQACTDILKNLPSYTCRNNIQSTSIV